MLGRLGSIESNLVLNLPSHQGAVFIYHEILANYNRYVKGFLPISLGFGGNPRYRHDNW
jgi:hypothetical protein